MFQPCRTISEVELDPELNVARSAITTEMAKVTVCSGKCTLEFTLRAARKGLTGAATVGLERQVGIESVEIRVIEKIEHLGAELNAIFLLEFPILGDREINVLQPGLPHESTS